jgi:4-amino-4-deoxy-L-arabinose transferase-like glycosyltransferase
MQTIIKLFHDQPQLLVGLAIILTIPALLVELGHVNIFLGVDEATRSVVALEMMYSGNYIVPTINGEFYYNKPPLYNWILLTFFTLTGSSEEFVMRLPNVLGLVFFAYLIYRFTRRHFSPLQAAVLAFFIISTGRVLFWESLFAYIDILFSAVLYANFMLIFHLGEKKQYLRLFTFSYGLAAVAFMLKGLPAVVFQGITLLVYFVWRKEWKALFSLQHLVGGLVFLLPVGLYYWAYSQYNGLDILLSKLWTESAQRTVVYTGWWRSFIHLFEFPVEMTYHYVPWSLFILFLFRKGFWKILKDHPFIKYNFLVFSANIVLYWASPEVYPKYILMLVPLIFTVGYFFYLQATENLLARGLHILFLLTASLAALSCLIFPFLPQMAHIPGVWGKSLLLFPPLAFLAYLQFRLPGFRILLLICSLLLFRLAFVWFIWTERNNDLLQYEEDAYEIVELTRSEPLHYLNLELIQHGTTFYLEEGRGEVLKNIKEVGAVKGYFIVLPAELERQKAMGRKIEIVKEFPYVETGKPLYLIQIKS